jgi:murein DD-endopeptidase MepM/ murein hydrolase activator NlpD
MRATLTLLTLTAASVLMTACIPQGADYRIRSAQAPVPRATAEAPLPVPEAKVINPTPSWSPAIVKNNSQLAPGGKYRVEKGDTLYRVVSQTGASLTDIAAANNLSPPYTLRLGQELTIPKGLYHEVSMGETGIAIARAYGVPWGEVVTLNGLQEPFVLNVGQRLRLPESASSMVVAPVQPGSVDNAGDTSPEQFADAFSLNIDDIVTGSEPAYAAIEPSTTPARPPVSLASNIQRPGAFAGSFAWPASGTLLSRFGSKGGGKVNDGINIAAGLGTAVKSAGNGVVVYSGNEIGVFGGLVLVDHGSGWVTAYGHLGQLQVSRGDKVRAGQSLGTVGDTGYVDQPQLHFEIRKDRRPVDPLTKLPVR